MIRTVLYTVPLLLCLAATTLFCQIKRDRNEGTFNIPATNVSGNGNIAFTGALSGSADSKGVHATPWAGLKVGITSILQLSGTMSVIDFRRLGGIAGRLQLTPPGNDRLRFFGVSISADLNLSTEMDTLSGTALTGRPDYHAYMRPSFTADLDWIALFPWLPVKTYASAGFADDPDLLYRYTQLALRGGMELKLEKNSYAIDAGLGLYKEKSRTAAGFAGDAGYAQQRFWIEPSFRYRLLGRFSLIGAARVLIFQRVKNDHPLQPTYVRITAALEAPVIFRETNSEAIRTMIFVERRKNDTKDSTARQKDRTTATSDTLSSTIEGLGLEPVTSDGETEERKHREEIQQKMEEIEHLLEDIK